MYITSGANILNALAIPHLFLVALFSREAIISPNYWFLYLEYDSIYFKQDVGQY